MRRLILTLGAVSGLLLTLPALEAGELTISHSSALPECTVAISCSTEPNADNVVKWHPAAAPGSRRDLGQRFLTGRSPVTVNRLILKLADFSQAIGAEAVGSELVFRLVRFETNSAIAPMSPPVIEASGEIPSEIAPGDYLAIDFPETELESGGTYGVEVGFKEPGEGRSLNIVTAARGSYPQGRIYFHTNDPDAKSMNHLLRSGNLIFYLGSR